MQRDLSNRSDIHAILADFYKQVLDDPIIGFLFTDVAKVDMADHLPIVVDFWSDLVFGGSDYDRDIFNAHKTVHRAVPLKPGHFTRWLHLFDLSIERSQFSGDNTDKMQQLAHRIAKSMSAALSNNKRAELRLSLTE